MGNSWSPPKSTNDLVVLWPWGNPIGEASAGNTIFFSGQQNGFSNYYSLPRLFQSRLSFEEWKRLNIEFIEAYRSVKRMSLEKKCLLCFSGVLLIIPLFVLGCINEKEIEDIDRAIAVLIQKVNKYIFWPRGMFMKKRTHTVSTGDSSYTYTWYEIALTPSQIQRLGGHCPIIPPDLDFQRRWQSSPTKTTTTTTTTNATTKRGKGGGGTSGGNSQVVWWTWKETPTQMANHKSSEILGDPDNCWIKYDAKYSEKLESTYQAALAGGDGTCDLGNGYVVDFTSTPIKQTKLSTGYQRDVQRHFIINHNNKIWCWKESESQMKKHTPESIYGNPTNCWIKYDDSTSNKLESAFQRTNKIGVFSPSSGYVVNFATMKQTKETTGYQREVLRVDADQETSGYQQVDADTILLPALPPPRLPSSTKQRTYLVP